VYSARVWELTVKRKKGKFWWFSLFYALFPVLTAVPLLVLGSRLPWSVQRPPPKDPLFRLYCSVCRLCGSCVPQRFWISAWLSRLRYAGDLAYCCWSLYSRHHCLVTLEEVVHVFQLNVEGFSSCRFRLFHFPWSLHLFRSTTSHSISDSNIAFHIPIDGATPSRLCEVYVRSGSNTRLDETHSSTI